MGSLKQGGGSLVRLPSRMFSTPTTRAGQVRANSAWNAVQQTANQLSSAVVGVLLVLALPVKEYGVYSYAASLVAIGVSVIAAGLNGLGVKAFVNAPDEAGETLTTLLAVRLGFSAMAYVALTLVSLTSHSGLVMLVSSVSLFLLFIRAFDAPDMWFLSRLDSRQTASIRLSVTIIMFAIRVSAFAWCRHIWFFVACNFVEFAVSNGFVLRRYLSLADSPGLGRPSFSRVRAALRQSLPLILSTVSNQVNLKIDIVLVQAYLGSVAVGVYAAAARVSELTYFLPVLVMNSTLPVLLEERRRSGPNGRRYQRMLQRSYDTAFWAGIAVAGFLSLIAPPIIHVLFGATYGKSVTVLLIHVWACPFVFMGTVYSKWIITEGYLWSSLIRHTLGAVVNILLNIWLIPRVGVVGAAWATLLSYSAANYLACFAGRKSRAEGLRMTVAIFWPVRLLYAWLRGRSPDDSAPTNAQDSDATPQSDSDAATA
jgi:O-antigen/teichoic acid export membrane protein